MSGSKVNNFSIGDSNIQSVMLTLDKAYKGLHQVSLTNYDNTSESQIAAGSVVENNGALYQFTSDESITGSPSNGTVYIRLVPDGDTITAEYTNTAPIWSDSKQGWYGTGGDANKRYIEFSLLKNSAAWDKFLNIDYFIRNNKSILSCYMNSHQSATGSQDIAFNTVTIDTNNNFDSGKFVCKKKGVYFIQGQTYVADTGFTYSLGLRRYKNSDRVADGTISQHPIMQVSCILSLDVGDVVKVRLWQGSAGQMATMLGQIYYTFFNVSEL